LQAFDHIKSQRSKIGSNVVGFIRKYFESPGFADSPENIHGYVQWALHHGGPAY
jgi:hypothetical protein